MGRNLGYAFEHEVEELLMALEDQRRSDSLAKRTRRQPASGAMESAKGDVVTNLSFLDGIGQLMVECKDRKDGRGDGKSVRIKKDELDKARKEAEEALMLPVFAFKVKQPVGGNRVPLFRGDKVNPMNTKWFAMPFSAFIYLLEVLRDQRRELEELRPQSKESPVAAPSSYGSSSKQCRACRKALERAVRDVERVMGGA